MCPKQYVFFLIAIALTFFSCNNDKYTHQENAKNTAIQILLEKSTVKEYSPVERLKFVDSAFTVKTSDPVDSLYLAIISAKSDLHYHLEQQDSTFFYDHLLSVKADKISNNHFLGKSHANLGFYYRDRGIYDSAYYHFNQSKTGFETIGNSIQVGRKQIAMGIIQQTKGDFFGSKETLTEALAFLEPKMDIRYIASAYNEIAKANRKLLNFSDAISYYKRAIELTTSKKAKLTFTNNLATVLIDDRQFVEAEKLIQTIIKDSVLENNPSNYARVLDNLAYVKWKNGNKNQGKKLFEALKIRKTQKHKRGQIASYTHLGEYFLTTNPGKTQIYLDTVIQLSKQLKIPKAEQDALKFLMDIQPQNVNIRNRYVFLQDSLFKVGLRVKTQFAKMKYDDEQKQLSILKLEAEKEWKNKELAEHQKQKIIWLSFSALLLIGGISVFYNIKQRHKKEKLQEVYITEKRISKKVHDELANDIYGVMTRMAHSENFQKENALDSLEDIYERTRDISHETGSINTDVYKDELANLLSQYRNNNTTIAVKGLSTISWKNISDEKKITLYRILNELLVNMRKHSDATLVSISFEQSKKFYKVEYSDNGKGLQLPIKKGAGLSNTENRIKNLEGTFSFDSEPGRGTRIYFTFPR